MVSIILTEQPLHQSSLRKKAPSSQQYIITCDRTDEDPTGYAFRGLAFSSEPAGLFPAHFLNSDTGIVK